MSQSLVFGSVRRRVHESCVRLESSAIQSGLTSELFRPGAGRRKAIRGFGVSRAITVSFPHISWTDLSCRNPLLFVELSVSPLSLSSSLSIILISRRKDYVQ